MPLGADLILERPGVRDGDGGMGKVRGVLTALPARDFYNDQKVLLKVDISVATIVFYKHR